MIGNIRLDIFQGPLDLLLTLIERQEIDVNLISVAEVTAQYLDFLHEVQELNLDWASEFLVLGAELLALKARLLLNHPNDDEAEEIEEEISAQAIAERLETYRQYKKAAEHLSGLAVSGGLSFGRPLDQEAVNQALAKVNPLAGVTLNDLVRIMNEVLTKKKDIKEPEKKIIKRSPMSLVGQIRHIWRKLYREKVVSLRKLLSSKPTRLEVALSLLAILELARRGRLVFNQKEMFGDIEVRLKIADRIP
ncbi:MAG: segregation and condensation protein [Clostridia bacterium]|nr:segregation and condensation protein [Clostridia bacterium]